MSQEARAATLRVSRASIQSWDAERRSAAEQSVCSSTELFPNDSARAIIPSYLAARAAAFQGTLAEQHALCPHFPMSDMVLPPAAPRSEEQTSELQSQMRTSS